MKKSRRHAFGQHFLNDRGTLKKIVDLIDPGPDDHIIEIGGGRGALTRPLAEKAGGLTVIEKDPHMIPRLRDLGFPRMAIVAGDILRQDFRKLARPPGTKVVGNLPYSISTPLLLKILLERDHIDFCVFLIQKEVADRICALPGGKEYAPLSIGIHNAFERKLHFKVKPGAFAPPPKVDSAVISLRKRPEPLVPIGDDRQFLRFLRGCFRQRRKTLANNLKGFGFTPADAGQAIARMGLADKARAEELSLEEFFSLKKILEETGPNR